jgi:PEP-CTERM motif
VQRIIRVALLTGALSASLAAGPIFGTFTIDGSVTVTSSTITWTSNTNVLDEATISSLGLSGSFIGTGNDTVTINMLTDAPGDQPVNTPFPDYDFIDFPAMTGFPSLLANFFALGSGGTADCSANVALAAAGQTCTLTATTNPAEPGGSPFTFLNTETGLNTCCDSSGTWDISGVTADGSIWSAVFTANFTTPFQAQLDQFSTIGNVSDAFAGALVVTIVPEPGTLTMLGSGLILLSLGFRRRKRT